MGRETECFCTWGDGTGNCKVLLEGAELILRGAIRKRVPLSAIDGLSVRGDELVFATEGVAVSLSLGKAVASSWAEWMTTPPPALAKKLGITAESHILMIGEPEGEEIRAALHEAASVTSSSAAPSTLVLVRASSPVELENRLGICWERIEAGNPVWVLYPKGRASTLGETAVRDKMRALGLIDTKVASVSKTLTALRFVRKKS